MMKIKLVILSILYMSTALMAQDYFIGGNYLKTKSSFSASSVDGGDNFNTKFTFPDDNNINLKLGLNNTLAGRIYIQTGKLFEYDDDGITIKYKSTSLNYDYYITKYHGFTPYVGVGLGYGQLSLKTSDAGIKGKGIDYTARIGTTYTLISNLDIEIGYMYNKSTAKFRMDESTNTYPNDYTEIEISTTKGLYFGINYTF